MSTTAPSNPGPTPDPIPEHWRSLVDDAAIFPPGNAPLTEAVTAHRTHRAAPYAELLGPFVVSDLRVPELLEVVRAEPADPLAVAVVVTGGAGAVEPAVRWAAGAPELTLAAVEVALRDEAELAHNAGRMTMVLDRLLADGLLSEDTRVFVEPPRLYGEPPSQSWLRALDELAAMDLSLKFRTGGVDADAFPAAPELATFLAAATDRELRFKCTAGLHHAVRHRDQETGFEQHGFLNVLLGTRASLDGVPVTEVTELLDEHDATRVRELLHQLGEEGIAATRRWFTSFGSCSVADPLRDLTDLDLLPRLPKEPA